MNDIDKLLERAGERWRVSQPGPPEVDPAALATRRPRSSLVSLFGAGAIGAILMLVIGAAALQLGVKPEAGGPAPVAPSVRPVEPTQTSASPSATGTKDCDVTRPVPVHVPPSRFPASPPAYYGADWFGSAALWTMLDRDGQVWKQSALPHGPDGLSQKTFWWSADWDIGEEPEPAITVTGTRLDGPGSFTVGRGTNAIADFGTAMLVGVEIPTPGCWQLTGRYREATLSYVVWITED